MIKPQEQQHSHGEALEERGVGMLGSEEVASIEQVLRLMFA